MIRFENIVLKAFLQCSIPWFVEPCDKWEFFKPGKVTFPNPDFDVSLMMKIGARWPHILSKELKNEKTLG